MNDPLTSTTVFVHKVWCSMGRGEARSQPRQHGVDFVMSGGETTGRRPVRGQVLLVVYTLRREVRRLISARRASSNSAEQYYAGVTDRTVSRVTRAPSGHTVPLKGRTRSASPRSQRPSNCTGRTIGHARPMSPEGHRGLPPRITHSHEVRAIRRQSAFASCLRAPVRPQRRTLQDWEQGRAHPDGPHVPTCSLSSAS